MKKLDPVIAIVAGVLILVLPGLLQWIIGGYLIVTGVIAISKK